MVPSNDASRAGVGSVFITGYVRRVIQTNSDNVLFSVFDIRRQVEFERCITVGPGADELAVEPDGGVGHCAVNVQIQFLSPFVRRNVEMFSIPRDAPPWKLTGFAGIVLIERPLDAPIMRQIQLTPTAVIKVALRVGNAFTAISCRPAWLFRA